MSALSVPEQVTDSVASAGHKMKQELGGTATAKWTAPKAWGDKAARWHAPPEVRDASFNRAALHPPACTASRVAALARSVSLSVWACLPVAAIAGQDGTQARTDARIGYVDVDEASAARKKAPPTCATARPYRPLVHRTPTPSATHHALLLARSPQLRGLSPVARAWSHRGRPCGLAHTLATPGPFATPTRCPCFWQAVHPKLPDASCRRKCPAPDG